MHFKLLNLSTRAPAQITEASNTVFFCLVRSLTLYGRYANNSVGSTDEVLCHHRCLASSMKSSLVALGSDSGVVRLIDAAALSLTVVFRARLCEGPITCMAFSPDAKALAVVAGNR